MRRIFFIIGVLSVLIFASCSIMPELQPTGKIVLRIKFPDANTSTRAIPTETNHIEVAVKEESSSAWTTKTAAGAPGSIVTLTFNVTPGKYVINAIAKKSSYHWYDEQVLAYASVSNVTVEPNTYTTATLTLMPFEWVYPDKTPELIEGATATLIATLVCPKDFIPDMSHSSIWLEGDLRDMYSLDNVPFTLKVDSISSDWATVTFVSKEFVVPQITSDTTVSYFFYLCIDTSKWNNCYMNSPKFPVILKKNGSGLIIIIQ